MRFYIVDTNLGDVIGTESELLRLERKIDDDVRGALFQNQREFYLQEQLRAIHKELGEDDGDDFGDLESLVNKKALPYKPEGANLDQLVGGHAEVVPAGAGVLSRWWQELGAELDFDVRQAPAVAS